MYMILSFIAVVASLLGLAYANLHPRGVPGRVRCRALLSPSLRPVLISCLLTLAALVGATIPAHRPWSEGMQLGWGLLIGGLLALYALYEAAGGAQGADWSPHAVGLLSAAALGPAAALLIFRGYPSEALLGMALGAAALCALAVAVTRPAEWDGEEPAPPRLHPASLELFAVATIVCAVGTRRAGGHQFPGADHAYWAVPSLLLSAAALVLILPAGDWRPPLRRWFLPGAGLLAGVAVVVLAGVLRAKLLPGLSWLVPLGGLLALAFSLAALLWEDQAGEEEPRPVALAFGAVLLALVVSTGAFRTLAGFGQMLAVLAALPVVGVAYLSRSRPREAPGAALAWGAFHVLLLLALYRVFLELVRHTGALDFQRHYDLLGVVLGASTLFALLTFTDLAGRSASVAKRLGSPRSWADLGRAVLWGVLLAATPLLLLLAWGPRCAAAYLAGLVVSAVIWVLLVAWTTGETRVRLRAGAPGLFLAATVLVAAQFAPLVQEVEFSRIAKVLVVGAVVVGLVLGLLLAARGQRQVGEEVSAPHAPEG